MKNWKTTLLGWIGGILPIVVKLITKQPLEAGDIVQAAGIIGLGHAAADGVEDKK